VAPLARSGGDDNGDQRRRLSDDAPGASTPPFRCLPVPVGAFAPPHPSWRRSSRRCRTSSRLASSWRALHRQNVEAIGRAGSRQCTWPARNVWAIGQAGSWLLVWPARGATHVSRATHASRDACKATPSHTAPTREWPCQARTREPPTFARTLRLIRSCVSVHIHAGAAVPGQLCACDARLAVRALSPLSPPAATPQRIAAAAAAAAAARAARPDATGTDRQQQRRRRWQ